MFRQESAIHYSDYRKWKHEHDDLKDMVKVLEKRLEDEKKNVLRRHRL